MTSKELTYQDIVKLRKQMQENNRNFYEQPIVITYQQAIQIENECLALEQENEKLKKKLDIYRKYTGVYYDEETKKYYIAVDCDFGCKGDVITKEEFEVLNDE